jgi:multicomponent Na+:H+ antiporter subunit D
MMISSAQITNILPGLPVALPLASAALLASVRTWLSRAVADTLGIAAAALALTVDVLLLNRSLHGAFVYWFGNWYPRGGMVLGIGFVVEPVGAGLAVLAASLTLLALIFSWKHVDSGGNHLQPLMLVFLAAMSGFVLTADIFNLFVFFELMSTAAFSLCGLKTAEPAPLQGTFNFAVTNTVAAFLVLTGIGMLYSVTGALNMAQMGVALGQRHDPLVLFAFTLLTCGFLIKGAIVPFHLWLPDAHAVAPTPVCVLFSGLMVELGIFAVVRLNSVVFGGTFASHPAQLRAILATFGIATVLLGGGMCYAEHHLKRLLAFSTICHAGLMLLAFAMGGPLAVAAMLTYLLAHALVKSGLFFTAGTVLHRFRSISEKELFGKGRGFWWTAGLWFLGGAGLAAAPPFATFLGEAGASHASELVGFAGISWVFLFGGVMTAAAVFRVGMRIFFGWGDEPITDRAAEVGELPETKDKTKIEAYHFLPPAFLLAAAAALGIWHGWLPVLQNASSVVASQTAYAHVLYTGHPVAMTTSGWQEELPGAALRGLLGSALAVLLALTSIFRGTVARRMRLGAFLEGGVPLLRTIQSGHPGDYVAWLTVGLAVFGAAAMALLRA